MCYVPEYNAISSFGVNKGYFRPYESKRHLLAGSMETVTDTFERLSPWRYAPLMSLARLLSPPCISIIGADVVTNA
jgi:hypothetical protein